MANEPKSDLTAQQEQLAAKMGRVSNLARRGQALNNAFQAVGAARHAWVGGIASYIEYETEAQDLERLKEIQDELSKMMFRSNRALKKLSGDIGVSVL